MDWADYGGVKQDKRVEYKEWMERVFGCKHERARRLFPKKSAHFDSAMSSRCK